MTNSAAFPPTPAISQPQTPPAAYDGEIELALLIEHLEATPPSFLALPRRGRAGGIHVDAVLADVIVLVTGQEPSEDQLFPLEELSSNHLRLILISSWLLSHPFFAGRGGAGRVAWLASYELGSLAELVEADLVTRDPERAEELCRKVLGGLGEPVANETAGESADRLIAIDSSRRVRLIRESQERVHRAEQVAAAMAAGRARDPVARFHRP
ncbi:MAG: hypothetical protein GY713_16360 [Actinomycetia bacterium]|nr:hypothetical protein [Actinomycetes bacterium]